MADSRSPTPISSQLSSHDSSEFGEDVKMEDVEDTVDDLPDQFGPPSKKRRTGHYSHQSTPAPLQDVPPEDLGEISSDTSGSIPSSPTTDGFRMTDEDPMAHEQVTVCRWLDCDAGDLGNMDKLVQHLQDEHVAGKQTNYLCEWIGCQRQGQAHASGYALKAHLRSHTKEKPFYCALPGKFYSLPSDRFSPEDSPTSGNANHTTSHTECDRSFTRSDALAKHMRTVHETEALRPSDPVPRNYSSTHFKPQRLKLIMNAKRPSGSEAGDRRGGGGMHDDDATIYTGTNADADNETSLLDVHPLLESSNARPTLQSATPLPRSIPPAHAISTPKTSATAVAAADLSTSEASLPPDALYKLLRRQLHWTEQEHSRLKTECEDLEKNRREEWMAKELVLANVMEAELAVAHSGGHLNENTMPRLLEDLPPEPLPMTGKEEAWYRQRV